MDTNAPELGDYFGVLRRRKYHFLVPAVVIAIIAAGLAFGLPPIYRATATILIEQQEIPQDLVRTTVTSFAAERIQLITKRVMTRANLLQIMRKFDLFPAQRKAGDLGIALSRMAKDIDVEMVSADIQNPQTGRAGSANIAFDLSFDYGDPLAAQKVVSDLAALYLKENEEIRTQKASDATDFLGEEARRLNAHINDLESRLARFKEKNVGRMPELMQMNMDLLQTAEREVESTHQEVTSLEERKLYLQSQLAQLEPNTGESPEGQLKKLQLQYLSESAIFSPDHPDLQKLRKEIAVLRKEAGISNDTSDLQNEYQKIKGELDDARRKYSEQHPDVVKLKRKLSALAAELKNISESDDAGTISAMKPDNPAYVNTETQLEGIVVSLKAAKEKEGRLREQINKYQGRLEQMPRIQQEMEGLTRAYDNATQKYHEIKQKQLEAQVAEQLERDRKGERFSLLEQPSVPGRPYKPNRIGILLLGMVLSAGAGIGVASLAEFFDQTVRGSKAVAALVGAPSLAAIPYIRNKDDDRRTRRRLLLASTTVLVLIALGLGMVHAFITPLGNLWSESMAKAG